MACCGKVGLLMKSVEKLTDKLAAKVRCKTCGKICSGEFCSNVCKSRFDALKASKF